MEPEFFRITTFALSSPKSDRDSPVSFRSPSPEPVIHTLKYSIRNILQPDFGKNAVLKTRVSFRPYEKGEERKKLFGVAPLGSLCQTVSQIGAAKTSNMGGLLVKNPANSPVKSPELTTEDVKKDESNVPTLWPAWVYCTRYSDRPSSGKLILF